MQKLLYPIGNIYMSTRNIGLRSEKIIAEITPTLLKRPQNHNAQRLNKFKSARDENREIHRALAEVSRLL